MMMRRWTLPVTGMALAALWLSACRKEADEVRWDVDVAVPLVRISMDIGDLLGDTLISADGQGNVSIVHTARLFEMGLDTLLELPDTVLRFRYPEFNIPPGSTFDLGPGAPFATADQTTRFDLQDLQLRELRVRSGTLGMAFVNRVGSVLDGQFALPGSSLGGSPLAWSPSIPAGSPSSPSTLSQDFQLDGYTIDLRGPGYNEVNTLAMELALTNVTGVSIGAADSVEAIVSYHGIEPRYARGYFGQHELDIDPDTSDLNAFEGLSGLLDLDQVTATLRITNGIGMDARARINSLHSVNSATGNIVPLAHAITAGPLNLDRALDLGNSFQPAVNSWTMDNGNSNIDAFIENLPDGITYDLDVTANPLGDVSNGNDFLYDDSRLTADLDVDIPLNIIATDLTLTRRMPIELGGTLEHHALRSGTLHLFADNRFPFSARAILTQEAQDGSLLDTIGAGGTIAAAVVDPNGNVVAASESQLDFILSEEQVDLFYPGSTAGPDGARLRITIVFNTADQSQHLRIRTDHTIGIAVSFEGNYIVNGDE